VVIPHVIWFPVLVTAFTKGIVLISWQKVHRWSWFPSKHAMPWTTL